MDRREALTVLGLPPDPTPQEIEHRYDIQVKRLRGSPDPNALSAATEAYNLLTGRTYVPEPPDPRDERVVFGKTVKQWKHIWHYGKVRYAVIALIAIAVVSIAWSILTKRPPDLKFVTMGTVYADDGSLLETWLGARMPDVKTIQFDKVFISETGDQQDDLLELQKAFVLLAAGDEDVVVSDGARFSAYVGQGAYLVLDDVWSQLKATLPAATLAKISPRSGTVKVADGGDGVAHVYGIDVSVLGTLQPLGLFGRSVILSVSVHTKHEAVSRTFLSTFFAQTDALLPLVTPLATVTPAVSPTATPAA